MRKLIKDICVLFVIILQISACREITDLDLPETEPQLVVEGVLSDRSTLNQIRLSTTKKLFTDDPIPTVDGALVAVEEIESGSIHHFTNKGQGLFESTNWKAKQQFTYRLNIIWNNQTYESIQKVQKTPQLDSLVYRYVPGSSLKEEGYYIYFYGRTPKDAINYYRWLVYKNDSLYDGRNDYLLASDEFVQEYIRGLEFPYSFELGDKVRIEMYSITKEIYDYFNELVNLLYNDGGVFSPPPVNPTSNIVNLTDPENPPLGYFQVATYVYADVLIK
jgi:hypothetical protein